MMSFSVTDNVIILIKVRVWEAEMSYSTGPKERRGESIGASTLCGFLLDIMEVSISILVRNRAGELKEVTSCSLIGFSTSLGVSVRERSSAIPRAGSGTL